MVRVDDLGVKLQAPDPARFIGRGRNDVSGHGLNLETRGKAVHPVPMAHPSLKFGGNSRKKSPGAHHVDHGLAEFAPIAARNDGPPERASQQLQTVADPQDGNPDVEKRSGEGRASFAQNRVGTSGEDHPRGFHIQDLFLGPVIRDDLAIDGQLPNPARDELGVLRTEIQY
jgi:hypothetical protein